VSSENEAVKVGIVHVNITFAFLATFKTITGCFGETCMMDPPRYHIWEAMYVSYRFGRVKNFLAANLWRGSSIEDTYHVMQIDTQRCQTVAKINEHNQGSTSKNRFIGNKSILESCRIPQVASSVGTSEV
jgi:hypothetical protein